jgi:arylsulfatase
LRLPRRSLLSAFLGAGACLAGCGGARPAPGVAGVEPRDVVIVVLDALRADALGCYGASLPTSPRIDAFAAESLLFEQAFAAASYTPASTASLFTGLTPAGHQVVGLEGEALPGEHVTLAETLAAAGFATAAFASNPYVSPAGGFGQGFAVFEHEHRDVFDRHAVPTTVLPDFLAWWRSHAGERRFAYVHVLPPHQPYDPPAPHAGLFGSDRSPREEGLHEFLTEHNRARDVEPGSDLALRLRARYDANVHYADAWFGELLAGIDAGGARERAAVLLTSDHGEAFAEHEALLHGSTAYTEMTRVPLVVRAPGLAPGRASGLVSTRDLAATLAEVLGLPWRSDGAAGRSFARLWIERGSPSGARVASRSVGNRPLWALRDERWTLVLQPASGHAELYDRLADPGERQDLAARAPERAAALAAELEALLASQRAVARAFPKPAEVEIDLDTLRDLGYVEDAEDGARDADTDGHE